MDFMFLSSSNIITNSKKLLGNAKILYLLGIFFLPEICVGQVGPTCENPVGRWVNEHTSMLIIDNYDSITGELRGKYRSDTGTDGDDYPLLGWVNSKISEENKDNKVVLTFTVRWGNIGSITAWTGTCSVQNKVPKIRTIWNLARPSTEYEWDHI